MAHPDNITRLPARPRLVTLDGVRLDDEQQGERAVAQAQREAPSLDWLFECFRPSSYTPGDAA